MRCLRPTTLALAVVLIGGLTHAAAAQLTQSKAQEILQKTAQAVNTGQPDPSLATDDEISITAFGMTTSRSQVNDLVGQLKQMGVNVEYTVTKVENLPGDRAAIAAGTYHVTYTNDPSTKAADGNFLQVLVREGQDWKTKALSTTRLTEPRRVSVRIF